MSIEQKSSNELLERSEREGREATITRKRNLPGVSLDKVRPYFSNYLNHEITIPEIAQKTAMSVNAVKSTLKRARKAGMLPPASEEFVRIAKSKSHVGRGRLQRMILPDLLQGMSIEDVMEKYSLSKSQVKGVVRDARNKGILPRPTREEISQKIRISNLGKPSPRKGKRNSADAIIAKLSTTKGEDVSELEKTYFYALVKAREIVDIYTMPRLEKLYLQHKRSLKKGHQGKKLHLLEMFYAAMVAHDKTDRDGKPLYFSLFDVLTLYNGKHKQSMDVGRFMDDLFFLADAVGTSLGDAKSSLIDTVNQLLSYKSSKTIERKEDLFEKFFLPLFLRNGRVEEVAKITGYDYSLVRESFYYFHKKGLLLFDEDWHVHTKQQKQENSMLEDDENYCLKMARRLTFEGFLSDNLSSWRELHKAYHYSHRLLPSFIQRLILEVFLNARKQAFTMNKTLLESYIRIGEEIDREWFENSSLNNEQFFITNYLVGKTELSRRLSSQKEKNVIFSSLLSDDDISISGRRIA